MGSYSINYAGRSSRDLRDWHMSLTLRQDTDFEQGVYPVGRNAPFTFQGVWAPSLGGAFNSNNTTSGTMVICERTGNVISGLIEVHARDTLIDETYDITEGRFRVEYP